MVFLTILIDALTFSGYLFQVKMGSMPVYAVGIAVQAVATLILIVWTLTFHRKRFRSPMFFGFFTATFSYGILLMSAAINALVLILYVMNIMGINHVIFS
ncbi:hypothetical protein IWT140_00622 [Secundilactobacillus pentosiphilus]|uniref:Uncharacterized protein n=1 Tax=Secundilactobacillus pentosiphilus TaxID=1714682 RepID=A0A1Z5IMP1_9LACO|nr:hypothetical protein [Secundilactobacillus pentosiphilus]GAX03024.1 hypothetical protein IWT140_00622 [Secundilactobacillus pentosiphilus]